jgi:vesicle transport protein SEC22
MLDSGVIYLCLSDRYFPKRLAFNYLDEVAVSFSESYGNQVESAQRPYAFIQFGTRLHEATVHPLSHILYFAVDTTLQRIKKNYKDSRNQQNLSRLNEELQNVTKIMTKNIQDVVQRGEKIDKLSFYSSHLVDESKKYARETKMLNWRALYRKYGLPLAVFFFLLFLFYFYWTF